MRRISLLTCFLVFVWSTGPTGAVDTNVVVRAKARDAMFIGTSMGGAHVVIRDAESGAVIANGMTVGDTAVAKPSWRIACPDGDGWPTKGRRCSR